MAGHRRADRPPAGPPARRAGARRAHRSHAAPLLRSDAHRCWCGRRGVSRAPTRERWRPAPQPSGPSPRGRRWTSAPGWPARRPGDTTPAAGLPLPSLRRRTPARLRRSGRRARHGRHRPTAGRGAPRTPSPPSRSRPACPVARVGRPHRRPSRRPDRPRSRHPPRCRPPHRPRPARRSCGRTPPARRRSGRHSDLRPGPPRARLSPDRPGRASARRGEGTKGTVSASVSASVIRRGHRSG